MCLFGELCGMSWWISVQLRGGRFSHHSKPPPLPPGLVPSSTSLPCMIPPALAPSAEIECFSFSIVVLLGWHWDVLLACQHCTWRVGLAIFLLSPSVWLIFCMLLPKTPMYYISTCPHDWICLVCGIMFSACFSAIRRHGLVLGPWYVSCRRVDILTCTSPGCSVPNVSGACCLGWGRTGRLHLFYSFALFCYRQKALGLATNLAAKK